MRPEVGLRPSPEKPLGYFLPFLPGYHLHNRQRKLQRPLLRFPLGKCPDGNSIPIRKRVGNGLKFLTINAYALGLRVAHSLELIADFVEFDGLLAGRQSMNIHNVKIVSDKPDCRLATGITDLCDRLSGLLSSLLSVRRNIGVKPISADRLRWCRRRAFSQLGNAMFEIPVFGDMGGGSVIQLRQN